ncbi:hypothetical protein DB346_21590 [Verrucomicrobia bacterium LW23]|nr:hypothetical protein DB346_21590 [Verrucomicrobia bacterium LW23]
MSCSLVTLLAFYVLSMVPVGRLYTAGYLASGTWHEEACKALYTPLLLAVKHLVGSAALLATGV